MLTSRFRSSKQGCSVDDEHYLSVCHIGVRKVSLSAGKKKENKITIKIMNLSRKRGERYKALMSEDKVGKKLTEEEKKLHHNLSEQKRREQLRLTYDRLVDLIPTLTPDDNRSELTIIDKSIEYIEQLRLENDKLMSKCREKKL